MAGHLTRKELKSDQVADTVEQTVDYFQVHRQTISRAAIAAVVLAVLIGAIVFYRGQQHTTREARLAEAMQVAQAPVGAAGTPGVLAFNTQYEKGVEETKVFSKLLADYPGTEEGYIAQYYLANVAVTDGKFDDARKKYQDVADHAGASIASLAKLSLAQIAFQENRSGDGEAILHGLIDNPTDMVSKEQAIITLADNIKTKNPAEARKILEPLATEKGEVAGTAARILNELPKK